MTELYSKLAGLGIIIVIVMILTPGQPTWQGAKIAVTNLGGPFNIYGGIAVLIVIGFFFSVFIQYMMELAFLKLLIWLRKRGTRKKTMMKVIDSLHKTFISWDKKVYYRGMVEKWYF